MKRILSIGTAALALAGTLFVTGCNQDYDLDDIKTDTITSLSTPANLTVSSANGSVVLDWDDVKGVAAYRVVRYDVTNSDKTGTQLGTAQYYTTTNSYWVDSEEALVNGNKYKYEVTALASTTNDDYVSRTVYVKDSGTTSKEVTAVVPSSVDVASLVTTPTATIYSSTNAVISLPTVAGLEYRFRFAAGESELASAAKGSSFVSVTDNSHNNIAAKYNPASTTNTIVANSADSDSNTFSSGKTYQLFLAVRAANTAKYGTEYTIINTGVTASYGASSTLSFKKYTVETTDTSAKYMLVVCDSGFANDNDSPANYTYAIKSYDLTYDTNGVTLGSTATTVVSGFSLTYDANKEQWGYETTVSLTSRTYKLYVLERTNNATNAITRKTLIVDYTTQKAEDAADITFYGYSATYSFNADNTTVTATNVFHYELGSDYTYSAIYVADGYDSNYNISSTFRTVSVGNAVADDNGGYNRTSAGSKTSTTSTPSIYPSQKIYVLALKKGSSTVLYSTTAYTYDID